MTDEKKSEVTDETAPRKVRVEKFVVNGADKCTHCGNVIPERADVLVGAGYWFCSVRCVAEHKAIDPKMVEVID